MKMILQILNGTIDPNWVTAALMLGLTFFIVRLLNRIDKKIDQHDDRIQNHEIRITVIEKKEES
jgi:hypothetical protein